MSSIAQIPTASLVYGAVSHDVTLLTTLETIHESFKIDDRVIPTTLGAGRRLSTSLHHTTLRLSRPSLEVLQILSLHSLQFLGAGALEDDGVCPFCFWNCGRV